MSACGVVERAPQVIREPPDRLLRATTDVSHAGSHKCRCGVRWVYPSRVTYRLADGEPIYGDYAWVSHIEYFEGVSEPTEVVKETWALVSSETADEVDEEAFPL